MEVVSRYSRGIILPIGNGDVKFTEIKTLSSPADCERIGDASRARICTQTPHKLENRDLEHFASRL